VLHVVYVDPTRKRSLSMVVSKTAVKLSPLVRASLVIRGPGSLSGESLEVARID
jgi:hypothetical protein